MSVVRKQTQQQKNAPGTSSFYSSNLKTASESPGFNKTKRYWASPAPSSIIINNKETTTLMAEKKKNETDDKNGGRPLTLWAAKSLIPLLAAPSLEHHRWIEAVVPLLDVLNQLPPLSLRDENMEMIESLQDALLQPHNVAKDADSERRRIATSTALATALQHGALGPILGVVQTLLESAQTQNKNGNEDAGNTAMFSIDSGRHMHYLRQIKTEYAKDY